MLCCAQPHSRARTPAAAALRVGANFEVAYRRWLPPSEASSRLPHRRATDPGHCVLLHPARTRAWSGGTVTFCPTGAQLGGRAARLTFLASRYALEVSRSTIRVAAAEADAATLGFRLVSLFSALLQSGGNCPDYSRLHASVLISFSVPLVVSTLEPASLSPFLR